MKNLEERRVVFCMPFISCKEKIVIGKFAIKPLHIIKNKEQCIDLLCDKMFNNNWSVVEVEGFNSGDKFSYEKYNEIKVFLEIIKISYFYEYPSNSMSVIGFVGNETFECHPVFEMDSNVAVFGSEHKLAVSNGMSNYLLSLNDFLKNRIGFFKAFSLNFSDIKLNYYYIFERIFKEKDMMDLLVVYNKCWSLYSAFDFSDKALFSKVSIELLSKRYGKKGNLVSKLFSQYFDELDDLIKSYDFINNDVRRIYTKKIEPVIDIIKSIFNDYFSLLNEERKLIAHEGRTNSDFINVAPYLIAFPAMILVLEGKAYLQDREIYRLIFMLGLFTYNPKVWQEIERDKGLAAKRNPLESYINFSICYPKYLEARNGSALTMLNGFENWLHKTDILKSLDKK